MAAIGLARCARFTAAMTCERAMSDRIRAICE